MGDALIARYWCYRCSQMVSPVMEVEIKCPFCESGFVEEMDGRRDHEMDLGSDRAFSLWAPILLGMMGGSRRRRRLRRESESEEEEEEDEESLSITGESDQGRDLEAVLRRRRRNSAAVLQLLQGLRAGLSSEQDNSENEREREQEQERVILVNPFNQAIILQGSFNVNQNQSQNQNHQAVPGSLGDYLIGPGLDLLLQHLAENDPNRYGSPPARKEVVEAMPTVKIEENLQCSVCLDDFEIGSEAKEMPCKHKFHDGCILPWLKLHSSCPVCRFQMPAEEVAKANGDGSRSGVNMAETSDAEAGNGNGRRTWLSVLWPFNGLFSLSGSQSGGNSMSNPSSSASQSTQQSDGN